MTHAVLYLLLSACLLLGLALNASAQATAREIRGAAPVVPLASEPPPKLIVDPPLPEPLALGRVVIQYRTENLRIVPVYGPEALDVSPRIGHIHVTVDDAPWHWADASNEPLILNGFPPGPHRVLIELADPTHKIIERQAVSFVVPEHKATGAAKH
ncbi:DUF6130 family protein [Hymenobacter sp. 15J16-1T3B]|uniref:DUF6130 family protein n=1 Tax=Hymenobacter sp. 15J16-1T3B TaxID=2886941 RepID=UPI001D130109|nr:DUF6130 family protein [Hymenobacter sp. 15J16-1T3B]MCC3159767.1 DUF6130 family protein [Hymenobacter sp. 15J16-1T3B]